MTICNVYVFPNGMVMVFNEHGVQMPDYQGKVTDVKERILLAAVPETQFHFGVWNKGDVPLTRDDFRRLHVECVEPENDFPKFLPREKNV
jgi:hypothetical protein